MSDEQELKTPDRLFVVVGEWGLTPFDNREAAERYPGPRMFECSPRQVVEFTRATPTSANSARAVRVVTTWLSENMDITRCNVHPDLVVQLVDRIAAEFCCTGDVVSREAAARVADMTVHLSGKSCCIATARCIAERIRALAVDGKGE